MKPNSKSQHREELLVFSGRVVSLYPGAVEMRTNHHIHDYIAFSWGGDRQVLFTEIFVTDYLDYPKVAIRRARQCLLEMFWEEQVQRLLFPGLLKNGRDTKSIARDIMEYLKEPWLPDILDIEIEPILPTTTRTHPWDGNIRQRVFSLSSTERQQLRQSWRQK